VPDQTRVRILSDPIDVITAFLKAIQPRAAGSDG
jgi:hypothetical protein